MELVSLIGQELGGFRLEAQLGEGGMAAVYKGVNVLNPQIARAIKVVRPELASRPEFVRRFKLEAQLLEDVTHPNIVRFFGLRKEGPWLFMELELLMGRTLARVLEERAGTPIPIAEAVEWVLQSSRGVAAAHERNLIHRDLKPENLFLSGNTVKVLDFGIARDAANAGGTRATTTGVPGSPPYMAPEVCRGQPATAAADVFALGISLYEILLGYHPLLPPGKSAPTGNEILFLQQEIVFPSLRQLRPDISPLLEQVVARAMAKDPAERYPSARELADALLAVQGTASANAGQSRKTSIANLPEAPRTGWTPPSNDAARAGVAGLGLAAALGLALLTGGGLVLAVGGAAAVWWAQSGEAGPFAAVAVPEAGVARAADAGTNPFVRVDPPRSGGFKDEPVVLGVPAETAKEVRGFRANREILAPPYAFELQAREVSWAELEAWLGDQRLPPPPWHDEVPVDQRAHLPATGVPWDTALAYCKSLGGTLPTEEEWEFAARGVDLRPYSWGSQPLDRSRTVAFEGDSPTLRPVGTSDQDQTPGVAGQQFLDLTGNALEWTADIYREDLPGQDESWAQGDSTWRAVRGIPPFVKGPKGNARVPSVGAAWRTQACGGGACLKSKAVVEGTLMQYVGFRCKRAAPAAAPR